MKRHMTKQQRRRCSLHLINQAAKQQAVYFGFHEGYEAAKKLYEPSAALVARMANERDAARAELDVYKKSVEEVVAANARISKIRWDENTEMHKLLKKTYDDLQKALAEVDRLTAELEAYKARRCENCRCELDCLYRVEGLPLSCGEWEAKEEEVK